MKKHLTLLLLLFIPLNSYSQNLEYRSVDYYFDIVKKSEIISKPKYILKDNEAVIEYIRGKKKKICKLKNVKEKEFLAYP